MFFSKLVKDSFHNFTNKKIIRSYKTNKNINLDKLIRNKKIKSHELYKIEDIEILLQEKHHDVSQTYPTINNTNQIVDVKNIPVFKKSENKYNILNKTALHFGDFSYLSGDAIVNGTNKIFELTKDGMGYDCSSNFLKACGNKLFDEIKIIREKNIGKNILITKGYNSSYKYIIHVIEPYYNQTSKLKKCYEDALLIAKENDIKTIVFPLIGSGISLFKKYDVVVCCLEGIYEFIKHKENFNFIDKIVISTNMDSYWILLRDSIPLYLNENTS
ncbi:Appr-1-p processing domain protein [Plasmodium berghei]|uniref:Appr-1-p processing domain protein n=2 Tax=Plasmodium berghei TaxID=5821 RepID=A0A509AW42_PLABA|nr:Appr-1-p processing domain protein [Plasmodium berghei ANKA]CXI90696.1 Appr-1-p processing domain protein [Plasmodium berghei]SCL96296.1 Appr-1-p processing domain protein [Plasmodium berghei]SCM16400.1 Appr-1-p processing domain protein [Plasmodium berghei]SCM18194.1 Appr-1-p processing domain protein [Plasmodium berghei]SCN27622.1 Appr-1-p processing domain protein [Plasmodium berghei]|eukprot:XP_034423277.1 Appr-1-p processing domain protein [Plasmodium berghei ANKA]